MRRLWEGEEDENIKCGFKLHPNGTALDWISSVDEWKRQYDTIPSEWDLASK